MKSFAIRIYVVALVLRLIPVLLSYNLPIGLDDMFQYDMLGRSLAAGEGYRWYAQEDIDLLLSYIDIEFIGDDYDPRGVLTSFRAPAYPAFLAVLYKIGGLENRFFITRLVQVFIGALLAPMTYYLGKRMFPKQARIGGYGAIAMAGYPMLVVYPLALATENIFIPLLLGAVLMLLRAGDSHLTRDYVFVGILLGLTSLTRSVVTAIIPFMMLWAWLYAKDKKALVIIPAFVFVFTMPWAIRNTLLHDRFTYVESSMGYNLYLGYHPEGTGTFQFGISLDLLPYLDDAERDAAGMQAAMNFVRADPGRVFELMLLKLSHFFSMERRALSYFYTNNLLGFIPLPVLLMVSILYWSPFVILASLAAVGLSFVEMTKERKLIMLVMFAYLLPHVLIFSEERFHLAIMPFIAVLAGYAWLKRKEIWARAKKPAARPTAVLALVLIGLLFFNWGYELTRDADKLAAMFGPEGNFARFDY